MYEQLNLSVHKKKHNSIDRMHSTSHITVNELEQNILYLDFCFILCAVLDIIIDFCLPRGAGDLHRHSTLTNV